MQTKVTRGPLGLVCYKALLEIGRDYSRPKVVNQGNSRFAGACLLQIFIRDRLRLLKTKGDRLR